MGPKPDTNNETNVLTSTVKAAATLMSSLNRSMAIVAGGMIVFISCLIVMNVLLRFLTGTAILGVEEIIQVAMVPAIFMSIGYCGQIGGHITVDIFENVFSKTFWKIVDPIVRIIGALAFAAMGWQAVQSGNMAGEFNELTNIRKIPHQPIWFLLAIGAAFAAVIEISKLWGNPKAPLVIEEESHDE